MKVWQYSSHLLDERGARVDQPWHELAADGSGGSCDEDLHHHSLVP